MATTKAWMNLLAPVARPVFEWNHDWVMARGGEGIAESARLPAACQRLSAADRLSLQPSGTHAVESAKRTETCKLASERDFPTLTSNTDR